ncbi:MAG: tetratricopeptide repeat protein, partial [Xanthomonadales bacterium]|nr:tetratricopeptide repeat protein [Xanthomonadales bacterium]
EEAGLKEEAIQLYDDALKVDPANTKALRNITDLLKAMDRVPDALPYLQRLAEQKPDDRDLQRELRDLE